ncbi:mandelate racemase/muconate lactonizing enzyme family protein [Paenibacillus montanisoli]|uniref:Mandelate racemase/muconate lactonizing enzyme family protein n=1 Tax=Paenibacillus montanisoli TaxID=2081970 RepID=A0A328U5U7_9BACL|nr:mandelate racemase/muconate lactonizing enzyme family protein [Paenibacillus montanisoli]RAP77930.1 mandelate racemase/muconate lactonizing enzyme family protein [Paenibacillus montanisoli]
MKISAIETIQLPEFPLSCFVIVETDSGIIGMGEATNFPDVISAAIHHVFAPMLIGQDPTCIEHHSAQFYRYCNGSGSAGGEMRAASALDIALWDIFGQVTNQPVYALLGGKVRDSVKIYNTCGSHGGRITGRRDDEWHMEDAGTLAEDLLKSNIRAMKIWPFDYAHPTYQGQHITKDEIKKYIEPVKKIHDAVGDEMEIAMEMHSCWNITSAVRIAEALEKYNIKWIEDPIYVDDADNMAMLREQVKIPVLASERLFNRSQFKSFFEKRAADIIMIDLGWTGGLTEGKKIASMSDAYRLPITTHNCGGPVLTQASAHFCISTPNAIETETLRAIYGTFPEVTDDLVDIRDGHIYLDSRPGLGVKLGKNVFFRTDTIRYRTDAERKYLRIASGDPWNR